MLLAEERGEGSVAGLLLCLSACVGVCRLLLLAAFVLDDELCLAVDGGRSSLPRMNSTLLSTTHRNARR